MALNSTIKTRILLRNDELSNWNSSSLVLGKGEVAIASINGALAEVRVGTGASTWANSLKLKVDVAQVSGLVDLIQGTAEKYQVVANGEGGNSWKLQKAALSGGDWSDVTGSEWSVDFSSIASQIEAVDGRVDTVSADLADAVADIGFLSGAIDTTNATLNTVSSDYLKASDFSALSAEIGLDAASSTNKVVTLSDIADLAGAMHFRGAVTPTEGQSDADAIAAAIADPASGDVVIITTNSKEYVYNGTTWIELGAELLYATKAEVATVSAELTGDIAGLTADVDYLSGQIDSIAGDYATKAEVAEVSAALSVDYQGQIDGVAATLVTVSSDYLTSTDKSDLTALVGTVSAETLTSANAYTDEAVAALSIDDYIKHGECTQDDLSGYFVFDCGGAALRTDEPAA